MKSNRPSIPRDVRGRIRAFVAEVERLQKELGVTLCIATDSCDTLGIVDRRREGDWDGYGHFDAFIHHADDPDDPPIKVRRIWFEDFASWEDR